MSPDGTAGSYGAKGPISMAGFPEDPDAEASVQSVACYHPQRLREHGNNPA